MKNILFVKARIEKASPIEPFLVSVSKEFIFKGEYFDDGNTIEEIRDKFYKDLHEENISYTHIYTYTTKANLDKSKQHEYLGE